MIPLAVTSNDWSLKRLGAGTWRGLHKLIYPIAVLGALHFLLLVKGFQWEPIVYSAIIAGLLASRVRLNRLPRFRMSRQTWSIGIAHPAWPLAKSGALLSTIAQVGVSANDYCAKALFLWEKRTCRKICNLGIFLLADSRE